MSRTLVWLATAVVIACVAVAGWAGTTGTPVGPFARADLPTILRAPPSIGYVLYDAGFRSARGHVPSDVSQPIAYFSVSFVRSGATLGADDEASVDAYLFRSEAAARQTGIERWECVIFVLGGPQEMCKSRGWVRANVAFWVTMSGREVRTADLNSYAHRIDARAAAHAR